MNVKQSIIPNQNNKDLAFFASLCMFLSAIEYIIPKPLPFMKIGLANMPILLSLYIFSPKQVFLLIILKVFSQSFITGTLFSYIFIFSLSGTLLSGIAMFSVYKIGKNAISPFGISLMGSLANCLSQILLSNIMLFGQAAQYIAPILCINAVVSGSLLGIFSSRFIRLSKWFLQLQERALHE